VRARARFREMERRQKASNRQANRLARQLFVE
jgi:hypothetical protein